MRISDVIRLNYNDIRNADASMKSHIVITEQKSKKLKRFPLTNGLLAEVERYTKNMKSGQYLFSSRKGSNKPISTTQAYRIITDAGVRVGLEDVGTHTMRKTFGYWHYQQYKDIAMLQILFNHSSPSITLKYIGIQQDEIDNSYRNFSL